MKKRTFLICAICISFSLTSFGQEVNPNNHRNLTAVLAIPSLKVHVEKIDQKEEEIDAAATSSRGTMTQLKEELASLQEEYKILLSNAISTTEDPAIKTALENEIHFVEQQLEVTTKN